MSEVRTLLKQIEGLKTKLKTAKKKEEEARRLKVVKLLESSGILDLDEAQIASLLKAIKRPKSPASQPEGQADE